MTRHLEHHGRGCAVNRHPRRHRPAVRKSTQRAVYDAALAAFRTAWATTVERRVPLVRSPFHRRVRCRVSFGEILVSGWNTPDAGAYINEAGNLGVSNVR